MDHISNISIPKNKWQFFYLLCVGKIQVNVLWSKSAYRWKFFFRTLFLIPFNSLKWLDILRQYPLVSEYLTCQTNLVCKTQRPYLSSKMSQKAKFNALTYHYRFLSQQSDVLNQAIYHLDKPFVLSELTVKNESKIQITIQSHDFCSREGEISVCFYNSNSTLLSILTFSIIEFQKKSTLFIGGLQGSNKEGARELTQKATKECYGLFPKRLVAEAITTIARYFQLEQIVAVGNQTHIYSHWRYKKRLKKMHSDYDDFWSTIGGEQNAQKLFNVPTEIPRKAIEAIASKKRSEYRNRYAILDQLNQDIHQQLSDLSK